MKHLTFLVIGFLASCSIIKTDATKDNRTLAIIGRDSVSIDEFKYAFLKNRPKDSTVTKREVDEYLDLYIKFKLKVLEAKAQGIDTTESFLTEYNSYVDQLNNSYLQTSNDTDSLVKEAFDRLQYEVKAAHILFKLDEVALPEDTLRVYNQALTVRDSIVTGFADFAQMALQYSDDPSAKQNKGVLGYFSAFQMVYPFETAAYSTAPGQISMPVRTRFGYHLVKVLDKRLNEGKIKVAHIMIRPSANAEEKAYNIYNQLVAGGDWNELCKQNSEDYQSAGRGGELVPFSRGQIVAPFADAAFGLSRPGEFTEPIHTPYGWHIIKLLERQPMDNFNALEQQLTAQVRRDSRSKVGREKMIERIANDLNFQENYANLQVIIDPKNYSFAKDKFSFEEDSLGNLALFSIQGNSYTASEFFTQVKRADHQQNTKAFLYKQYMDYRSKSLFDFEKAHLGDKYPEYNHLVREYHDGILLFTIMEDEVWNRASNDSTGLADFYEQNKADFIDSSTLEVAIFSATTGTKIDSIRKVIDHRQKFIDMDKSEKVALNKENNAEAPLSLWLEYGEFNPETNQILQDLPLPIKDTVFVMDSTWHYVLVVRDMGKPRRMENVRGQLVANYQDELEKKWIAELENKYSVVINGSGRKKTYKELGTQ